MSLFYHFPPHYFLKFPSCTPLRPVTQRKVAGCMAQYLTGLAKRLMPVYRFFLLSSLMGQKSLIPTLLILLPWRKITWTDGQDFVLVILLLFLLLFFFTANYAWVKVMRYYCFIATLEPHKHNPIGGMVC